MASKAPRPATRAQLRQPRLADIVAKSLRDRIISGEIADGSSLPTLDRLVTEFGVSAPSIREALRILESEGLISVRRGHVGGAVTHVPKPATVAYAIGIILQSRQTQVADLETALVGLEPLCAGFCARRPDRAETVVPELRATCEHARETIDDPMEFGREMRLFHRVLVRGCGNETLGVVVGALEWLWGRQRDTWAHRITAAEGAPGLATRSAGLRSHEVIVDAIERGKVELAEHLVRDHVVEPDVYAVTDRQIVEITEIPPGSVNAAAGVSEA